MPPGAQFLDRSDRPARFPFARGRGLSAGATGFVVVLVTIVGLVPAGFGSASASPTVPARSGSFAPASGGVGPLLGTGVVAPTVPSSTAAAGVAAPPVARPQFEPAEGPHSAVVTRYNVTFRPYGLPSSIHYWLNVTEFNPLNGTTTIYVQGIDLPGSTFVVAPLANGTYNWTFQSPTLLYVPAPDSGHVVVNGNINHVYTFFDKTFTITISAQHLPPGTNWSLRITNASDGIFTWTLGGISMNFSLLLINGSYNYAILTGPTNWSPLNRVYNFLVKGTTLVPIFWDPVTDLVDFYQDTLPLQTNWSVTVTNGTGNPSGQRVLYGTASTLHFLLQNGSYNYSVHGLANYSASPPNGTFVVSGTDRNFSIDWTVNAYRVTFIETGLPASTNWEVSIGSLVGHSNTSTLDVLTPNGTGYSYQVASLKGFTADPQTGRVTVSGGASPVDIAFTAQPVPKTNSSASPSPFVTYAPEIGIGVVALVVLIVLAVWMSRRGGGPALAPSPAPAGGDEAPPAEDEGTTYSADRMTMGKEPGD